MTKYKFDHSYCMNISEEAYKKFGKMGFEINLKHVQEHPGSNFCRFIKFKNGYLEFIEIKNLKEYEDLCLKEKIGKDDYYLPGLSLAADKDLEKVFKENKERFKCFDIEFSHQNYDWEKDIAEHLPGWNFLDFNKKFIPAINLFIIEYESNPDEKNEIINKQTIHKNSCTNIVGMYLIVSSDEETIPFSSLTGSSNENSRIVLDSEFIVYVDSQEVHSFETFDLYKNSKTSSFKALILECSNLEQFKRESGINEEIQFDGRKACRIIQNKDSWDLIVVETK